MGAVAKKTGGVFGAFGLIAGAVVVAVVGVAMPSGSASASTPIEVGVGGCTLVDAVRAANTGTTAGSCTNLDGSTTIRIPDTGGSRPGVLITEPANAASGTRIGGAATFLPDIEVDITIEGENGAGIFFELGSDILGVGGPRLAYVAPDVGLTLRNTVVSGFTPRGSSSGLAPSCPRLDPRISCDPDDDRPADRPYAQRAGDVYGGAVYVDGRLRLERVLLLENGAQGGSSGYDDPRYANDPDRSKVPKNGGSAFGGAIYSNGEVTITDSVFAGNNVIGGDGLNGDPLVREGGSGGGAIGADMALSASAAAAIDGTLFLDSRARAGDGGWGLTADVVKNLVRAPRGAKGARGFCDDNPTFREASGDNGRDGGDGVAGSAGGSGGLAVGSVYSAGSVTIENSTIRRPLAQSGAAGMGAVPQQGGQGGDGGFGVTCRTDSSFGDLFDVGTKKGDGGNGGDAGDHGRFGGNGDRGDAVAAVDAAVLSLVNTTITESRATIPADVSEPAWSNRAQAIERIIGPWNPDVGRRGLSEEADAGASGIPGERSFYTERTEASLGGDASVVRSGDGVIAFSTVADAALSVPGSDNGRTEASNAEIVGQSLEASLLRPRPGFLSASIRYFPSTHLGENRLSHSILSEVGNGECPGLSSLGFNVVDDDGGCVTALSIRDVEFASTDGRSVSGSDTIGELLATSSGAIEYRLSTREPTDVVGSTNDAIDRGRFFNRCSVRGTEISVEFDARGVERTQQCDAGAHELRVVVGIVYPPTFPATNLQDQPVEPLAGPGGDGLLTQSIAYELYDPSGTTTTATMLLDMGPGFVGRVIAADGSVTEGRNVSLPISVSSERALDAVDFFVDPGVGSVQADVVATLEVAAGVELISPQPSITGAIQTERTPDLALSSPVGLIDVARCTTDHPVEFSITPDGSSRVPSLDATLSPGGTPRGLSAGTAVDNGTDLTWTTPEFTRTDQVETATVLVDAGDFAVGDTFVPSLTYPRVGAAGDIVQEAPEAQRRIVADPDLDVVWTGLDGVEPGQTSTVTANVVNRNPDACADITGATLTVDAPGAGGSFTLGPFDLDGGASSAPVSFSYSAPNFVTTRTFSATVEYPSGTGTPGAKSFDETFPVAFTPPIPTVARASGQESPTNDRLVDFIVSFDKPVDGFGEDDIELSGSAGADSADVPDAGTGSTYTVRVSGMTQSGEIIVSVPGGAVFTADGFEPIPQPNVASNDVSVEYDIDGPVATISRVSDAVTSSEPVTFRIEVAGPVNDVQGVLIGPPSVTSSSLMIGGTTGAEVVGVDDISTQAGVVYEVRVGNAQRSGDITLSLADGAFGDALGNDSTSVASVTDPPIVELQRPPSAPIDAVALPFDEQIVDVEWDPPVDDGGVPVSSYRVESSVSPGVWSLVETVPATDTTVRERGLSAGTPVEFRVIAINGIGEGPPSEPSNSVTPNPRPRVDIELAPGQTDPIRDDVIRFDVDVIRFIVSIDQPVVAPPTADQFVIGGSAGATEGVLTEIEPFDGTTYELAIDVSDFAGFGALDVFLPALTVFNDTGQGSRQSSYPEAIIDRVAPVAVISPDFGQPTETSTGPIEFRVRFDDVYAGQIEGFDEDDISIGGTAGATSFTLSEVDIRQTYRIVVDTPPEPGTVVLDIRPGAAVDPAGNPSVNRVVANTVDFIGRPGVAQNVSAGAGNETATVSWSAPSNTGGLMLDSYRVEMTADDGATFSSVGDTDGETTNLVVTDLNNGVPVRFRVTAVNSFGVGSPSSLTDAVTPTVVPTVSLLPVPGQGDPATTSPVRFVATFSENVVGLEESDVVVGGDSLPTNVSLTGSGSVYEVEVSGMTADGALGLFVREGAARNANGQPSEESNTPFVAFDGFGPVATIDLAPGQAPTVTSPPIVYSVVFDGTVTGFDASDVTVSGTAAPGSPAVAGGGADYAVTIDSVGGTGTVVLAIADGAVVDAVGKPSTSIVVNDTVTVTDPSDPVVVDGGGSGNDPGSGDGSGGGAVDDPGSGDGAGSEGGSATGVPWSSVVPGRYLETRVGPGLSTFDGEEEGIGRRSADEVTRFDVGGRGGIVPADAIGAIVNITAIRPLTVGFVTAWSCEGDQPLASSLNYSPGVSLGNEVVVELGPDGEMCLFNSSEIDVVVDVVGYLGASSPVELVSPARLVETRSGPGLITIDGELEGEGALDAGEQLEMQIAGRGGVDPDAVAVIANVTSVNPQNVGFFTLHPCLDELPLASSLNYRPGVNRGNEVVIQLDDRGRACLFTSAASNVTLDVVGFLPAGSALQPVGPARLLDTRTGPGIDTIDGDDLGGGPLPADDVREVQVAGRAGVDVDATSVVMNVTVVQPSDVGFLTIWPCGSDQPLAASLNFVAGVNGGSEVVAGLGDGKVCVYNSAATDLTVDITGFTAT